MVKIAIKIAVLVVVLVAMFLGFNLFVKKPILEDIGAAEKKKKNNEFLNENLVRLVSYKPMWDPILMAQKRDLEYIRAVIPEMPFAQNHYLRQLRHVFQESGVRPTGMSIRPVRTPPKHLQYLQFYSLDPITFVTSVMAFQGAFEYLKENDPTSDDKKARWESLILDQGDIDEEELALALWYSFRFNQKMSVSIPDGLNLVPGLEIHRFDTSVRGSYEEIKKFLWLLQNLTPHTVIVNWHLKMGPGVGESRNYTATLSLITFVDSNEPPTYGKEILGYKYLPNEVELLIQKFADLL